VHLLLVDGSNLLFQMFYGMPSRIVNHRGKAIQGTLGFVGALLKILRSVEPTHAAVLFDGECGNPRRELDSAYKDNRTDFSQLPEEETPFSQLPDIYAALDFLGIAHGETESCEADDWIAAYARRIGEDDRLTIVSQDSDLYQLIRANIHILRYRGEKTAIWDGQMLQQKLGILPQQYAAYKALTGDTADNIRGADKVGPKTAAWLLQTYGDLENLLALAHTIPKPAIRESVQRNRARILLNYQLICLAESREIPFPLEQLAYTPRDIRTIDVLRAIGLRE